MLEAEGGMGDGDSDDEVMESLGDDVEELMWQGRGGPDEEGPDRDEDAVIRAFDEGACQEPPRLPAASRAPRDPPRSRTRNVMYIEALQ